MNSKTRSLSLLLLFLSIGALLRILNIGYHSLWFDEAFTRDLVNHNSFSGIAQNIVVGELHPPLHFLLLKAWVQLVGDSDLALRMISALVAILAIPAFYYIGRLLFNERVGTIALILGSLSPLQVYYAQETRNYIFAITCTAWALVGLLTIAKSKRYGWLLYVIASVFGLYTHYFVGLVIASLHMVLFLYSPFRKAWKQWLSADIAIGLLFVPQIFQLLPQLEAIGKGYWIPKPNPAQPLATLTFMLFGTTLPPALGLIAIIVLICTLAIIALDMLTKVPPHIRDSWLLCAVSVLAVVAGVYVYSMVRNSIYLDKSFSLLSPLFLTVLAAGIVYARRPSPVPFLGIGLVFLMIIGLVAYLFAPDPTKPPFRQIAADLMQNPDALSVPIVYLHDSAALSIDYYAPKLKKLSKVIDLEDKSWLWPQGALFPQTWQIFGFDRPKRSEINAWLANFHGKLRVIAPVNLEPEELNTLTNLLKSDCTHEEKAYPSVSVYEFICP
jgi:uncharacterized membrane protein